VSPWRPLDRSVDDDPRPLRESLEQVARDLGAPDAGVLRALFTRWEDVVGASVAVHAKPTSLRDGTLKVVVDQPGWATQLRYLTGQVMARCDEVLGAGAVREVDVRVDPRNGVFERQR
jgi:predicted nucleic acid-binding Zn ribbon protein